MVLLLFRSYFMMFFVVKFINYYFIEFIVITKLLACLTSRVRSRRDSSGS